MPLLFEQIERLARLTRLDRKMLSRHVWLHRMGIPPLSAPGAPKAPR
jgi:hypothetical protein